MVSVCALTHTHTSSLTHTNTLGSHILCLPQMLRLWRRDVPLLGGNVPAAAGPSPPPTAAPTGPNISWIPEAPLLGPDKPIFLMTPAAQAVSGFFVWTALILTCHQVSAAAKKTNQAQLMGSCPELEVNKCGWIKRCL